MAGMRSISENDDAVCNFDLIKEIKLTNIKLWWKEKRANNGDFEPKYNQTLIYQILVFC